MSSAAELLESHARLRDSGSHLLDLARGEQWEALLEAMHVHQLLEVQVQEAYQSPPAVTAEERAQLEACVDAIALASDELIERLSLQQAEVGNLLEDIRLTRVNGRRLRQHYGG